jgi:hypothetical protein
MLCISAVYVCCVSKLSIYVVYLLLAGKEEAARAAGEAGERGGLWEGC